MVYRSVQCPYCGLELQVPKDAKQAICTYCAKPIDLSALLHSATSAMEAERYLEQALAHLDPSLFRFAKEANLFTQKEYPDSFADYSRRMHIALEVLQEVQEKEKACHAFAQALFSGVQEALKNRRTSFLHGSAFFQYRMFLAVYLVPALHDSAAPQAKQVLENFLKLWNEKYPKEPLQQVGFAEINAGWQRRGCYITTAVCQSLQKGDDCLELQVLRTFRDGWLRQQPAGPTLIWEYYIFAPAIVQAINKTASSQAIYQDLWEHCIVLCVQDLLHGENICCLRRYLRMVCALEARYLGVERRKLPWNPNV